MNNLALERINSMTTQVAALHSVYSGGFLWIKKFWDTRSNISLGGSLLHFLFPNRNDQVFKHGRVDTYVPLLVLYVKSAEGRKEA